MELRLSVILFGAAVIVLLVSIVLFVITGRSLAIYTEKLMRTLDAMAEGRKEIAFDEEKDTLIGKLQVKMRRIYEIMQKQARENQKERRQIEEMVGDIAHQIKTPAASIRMYHDLLLQEGLGADKRQEFLEGEAKQLDKLEFLMDSMIRMSRLETGLIQLQPGYFSVWELIQQAVCDVALKAEERDIDIQAECKPTLRAWFDRKWTLEALVNVLDNAVKYNCEHGKIYIRAQATDYFVRIQVKDTGPGIREEAQTDIFKRFYREMESAAIDGMGIGLYLTRQIVTLQKGYVEVFSERGKGALFSIHLPIEKPEDWTKQEIISKL